MDDQYIHDLILKEHYGLLNPEEQEELDALLANSEEARKMRDEIQRAIPKEEALDAMGYFDVDRSFDYIQYEAAMRRRKRRMTYMGTAAVLLVLVAGAYLFFSPGNAPTRPGMVQHTGITLKLADGRRIALQDSGSQTISLQSATLTSHNRQLEYSGTESGWNTLTVPPTLDFRLKLADGTIVWLNSISEIKFPFHFNEGKREVYIKGEAYFKVAPNANMPFVVHTSSSDITVLGTEFNVNAYNQGIITTSLVSGKVTVSAGDEKVELEPGTEAVVRGGAELKVQAFNPKLSTWREGVYYFEDITMREIAAALERWYDEKIVIDNARAAGETFRLKLHRSHPLQSFLDQLNETGQVTLYRAEGMLHCK